MLKYIIQKKFSRGKKEALKCTVWKAYCALRKGLMRKLTSINILIIYLNFLKDILFKSQLKSKSCIIIKNVLPSSDLFNTTVINVRKQKRIAPKYLQENSS